jgi:hypothetical protein
MIFRTNAVLSMLIKYTISSGKHVRLLWESLQG